MSLENSPNSASSSITPEKATSEKDKAINALIAGKPVPALANGKGTGKAEAVRGRDDTPTPSTSTPESEADELPDGKIRPALELDDDGSDEAPSHARKTIRELAKETGVSVKKLMESLIEFDGEDLEPVPLRELKDTFREHKDLSRQRDDFEYERSLAQNEVLVARQQVQGLVDRIVQVMGPGVFEQVLGQVRGEQVQQLSKAKAQLLEFYPQWQDAQVMQADRNRLEDHLSSYGFSRFEVGAIQDARLVKYAMDAMKLKERYDRLRSGVTEKVPTTAPPSTRKHLPNKYEQAKALAAKGDKNAALNLLVGG